MLMLQLNKKLGSDSISHAGDDDGDDETQTMNEGEERFKYINIPTHADYESAGIRSQHNLRLCVWRQKSTTTQFAFY
jgi:hypothetical protein